MQTLKLKNKLLIETKYLGCSQQWFLNTFYKTAGCGICAATNLFVYTATDNKLFAFETKKNAIQTMQFVSKTIKPTIFGIYSSKLLAKKMRKFILQNNLDFTVKEMKIKKNDKSNRDFITILDFITQGLKQESPVAFLNLHNGQIKTLDTWHWVTILGIEAKQDEIFVIVSDQGNQIIINFSEWYKNTRRNGGLIYLEKPHLN